MRTIQDLLHNASTIGVVCLQWGDTGKGKFVDLFAEWTDIIARGTGGANAGHTIVAEGKTLAFHLVPSGILHDKAGKTNIIGNGVAFDPRIFCEELTMLDDARLSYNNLMVARNAHLVLPTHLLLDRLHENRRGSSKIGTTGRGIGPVYADHVTRIGLTVSDLFDKDLFAAKLQRNLEHKLSILKMFDPALVREILEHPHLENGKFWHSKNLIDIDAVMSTYAEFGKRIKDMVRDTDVLLQKAHGEKRILLEGAQGHLLSVDYGAHPFVTSSDPSIRGLAHGVGLSARDVDRVFGLVKGLYMTRVGAGPFPTELGGKESDDWCNDPKTTKDIELEHYPTASTNSSEPLEQGIGIRLSGGEYGVTTKRPRRTGWLDLPLLRYARIVNGNEIVMTKIDVLDECKTINVCTAYQYTGPLRQLDGQVTLHPGDTLTDAIQDADVLRHCEPIYEEFPGWCTPTTEIRRAEDLPEALMNIVRFVEEQAGVHVAMVSVGPDREQTIVMER